MNGTTKRRAYLSIARCLRFRLPLNVSFLEAKQSLKELRGIVNRQLSNDEDSVVGSVGEMGRVRIGRGKDREGKTMKGGRVCIGLAGFGGRLSSGNSVDSVPLCLKKEV